MRNLQVLLVLLNLLLIFLIIIASVLASLVILGDYEFLGRLLLVIEDLLGDAAPEVRLAQVVHVQDRFAEAGDSVSHTHAGTRLYNISNMMARKP